MIEYKEPLNINENDDNDKSSFKQRVILEVEGKYTWILHKEFEYYRTDNPNEIIQVPKGTVTDLATVPRILWSVVPPLGLYTKAAIIHDYLYQNAIKNKKYADDVFLEAMTVAGVPKCRRWLMYQAVRIFGRGAYQFNNKKMSKTFNIITRLNRWWRLYKRLDWKAMFFGMFRCIKRMTKKG